MTQASSHPLNPANALLHIIGSLLAPIFLDASGGDIALARLAAMATVTAYPATTPADQLAAGQVIAFGLAALGALSRSLADDDPPAMKLRLRGNANALNRSAEQNRRLLGEPDHPVTPAARMKRPALSEQPKTPRQAADPEVWAAAMVREAAKLNAGLANLSPADRKAASFRAETLSSTASELLLRPAPRQAAGFKGSG
jgi:hypothetical protein